MITLLRHVFQLLPFLWGGHRQLALENVALRQQLTVHTRTMTRSKLRVTDRLFWVGLARTWAGWRRSLVIVTPETVLRWQRRRFRAPRTRLSGRPAVGRPPVNADVRTRVVRMAAANPLWGAPRIHGELVKLGITVAEPIVSRFMPKRRSPPSQTWCTFLTNHVRDLVSIDFFTVPTARVRVLVVLVGLAHQRRRVVPFHVTEHPTAAWTAPQIVEAFPNDTAPSSLLRDRDHVDGNAFRHRVKGMGIAELLTAPSSPWQNPFAERLIGSIRRECLEPVSDLISLSSYYSPQSALPLFPWWARRTPDSPDVSPGLSREHRPLTDVDEVLAKDRLQPGGPSPAAPLDQGPIGGRDRDD